MLDWIKDNFGITEDGTFYITDTIEVNVERFLEIFGDSISLSARDLKARDPNDVAGYHSYIDMWKEKGLID